jgi:hypothetical protein
MMAKKYDGTGEEVHFGSEALSMSKVSSFLRRCGFYIAKAYTYRQLGDIIDERMREIRRYFRDELEVLEQ